MLTLTRFQRVVAELVLKQPAPGKHAARHAIEHIRKAWTLKKIDPNMSAFRSVVGEEEAARAVIHALQRRQQYDRASELSVKSHVHKLALCPFIDAILSVGALNPELREANPTLQLDPPVTAEPVRGNRLRVRVTEPATADKPARYIYAVPPLNFGFALEDKPYDFRRELAALTAQRNVRSIVKLAERSLRMRSEMLYATERGIPAIQGPLERLTLQRRNRIFRLLTLYLLIDPYAERQIFVQQALYVFLQVL